MPHAGASVPRRQSRGCFRPPGQGRRKQAGSDSFGAACLPASLFPEKKPFRKKPTFRPMVNSTAPQAQSEPFQGNRHILYRNPGKSQTGCARYAFVQEESSKAYYRIKLQNFYPPLPGPSFGSGGSLSPMQIWARKASFLLGECTLLVLDPNKKRSLTKYHGKLTHYLILRRISRSRRRQSRGLKTSSQGASATPLRKASKASFFRPSPNKAPALRKRAA